MLEHGGRLRQAAVRYGIALGQWIDLSTGIDPIGYPAPALSPDSWRRLPEEGDGLEAAAARYYGNASLLPVAGSQAAIQALPILLGTDRSVAVLAPIYAEHPAAWERAGHHLTRFAAADLEAVSREANVVVLCNPNNPDAGLIPRERLLTAAATLAARDGWLLVDEAFMDATPHASVVTVAGTEAPNLIVLRSIGKFFGLAGARVGFVFAVAPLLAQLTETLGPWTLNGPARDVARQALADLAWQTSARLRQQQAAQRLAALLSPLGPVSGDALFCWLPTARAAQWADALARQGILVRCFDAGATLHDPHIPSGLRFGLPANEHEWTRLAVALKELR